MNTTADQMRQSAAEKSEIVPLTSFEAERMLTEIDNELLKLRQDVGNPHKQLAYRLRSFLREAPNEGKCFGRNDTVIQILQAQGFNVNYTDLPVTTRGQLPPNASEFLIISWP